jgi:hypothetical protein
VKLWKDVPAESRLTVEKLRDRKFRSRVPGPGAPVASAAMETLEAEVARVNTPGACEAAVKLGGRRDHEIWRPCAKGVGAGERFCWVHGHMADPEAVLCRRVKSALRRAGIRDQETLDRTLAERELRGVGEAGMAYLRRLRERGALGAFLSAGAVRLTENELRVLELRLERFGTNRVIGEELGMSAPRISQLHKGALRKLASLRGDPGELSERVRGLLVRYSAVLDRWEERGRR